MTILVPCCIGHEKILTPERGGQQCVEEEALTTDTSAFTHTCVLLGMKCVEESTRHEIGRPDLDVALGSSIKQASLKLTHGRWLDKEAPGDATDRESNELGRHNDHPLIFGGRRGQPTECVCNES